MLWLDPQNLLNITHVGNVEVFEEACRKATNCELLLDPEWPQIVTGEFPDGEKPGTSEGLNREYLPCSGNS
jgi:hypothetical protein